MSARSMTPHRKYLHSDRPKQSTFAEVSSEPWPTGASDPYICRYIDTEDSDIGKAYSLAGLQLVITLILSADVKVYFGWLESAVSEDHGNAEVQEHHGTALKCNIKSIHTCSNPCHL